MSLQVNIWRKNDKKSQENPGNADNTPGLAWTVFYWAPFGPPDGSQSCVDRTVLNLGGRYGTDIGAWQSVLDFTYIFPFRNEGDAKGD